MVKRVKDKNAPKRPLTGFFLFRNDLRTTDERIKAMPFTEQATAVGQLWKDLDEASREKYNAEAEKLKEQYKSDLAAYEQTDSYKKFKEEQQEIKEGKKKRTRRGPIKMSGYRLFMKENKDTLDEGLNEEDAGKKHIAKCGLRWKMLSEKERAAYNERASKMEDVKSEEEGSSE